MPAGSFPASLRRRPSPGAAPASGLPSAPRRSPALSTLLRGLLAGLLVLLTGLVPLGLLPTPARAALENDRYDGNIFALYAGNGSLVPPRSSLSEALADGRVAVVIFYLDDSSVSKRFAPLVSELQRLWGNAIELIPLVTDPLLPVSEANRSARAALPAGDPSRYWSGLIPEVVVFDRSGAVAFQASGQVSLDAINAALSRATDLPLPQAAGTTSTRSFNELNSEVVSAP
ncbi:MAG: thylakoid membrane photosystem I accumulation factor [Synechococcaceae cyanobacterium]|nr:thylakoid membrane photosystem I accumulation factor [Synechococcaceae cyanobacterium]